MGASTRGQSARSGRARWVLGALTAAIALGALAPPRAVAQQPNPEGDPQIERLATFDYDGLDFTFDLVLPDQPMADLPPSAFELRQGGQLLPAEVRRLAGPDLEVVLVIDPAMRTNAMVAAQGAVRELVLALPAQSMIGLVAARQRPEVLVAPTTGRSAVLEAVIGLTEGGGRSMLRGIELATSQFSTSPEARRTIVAIGQRQGAGGRDDVERVAKKLEPGKTSVYQVDLQLSNLGGAAPRRLDVPRRTGRSVLVGTSSEVLYALDGVAADLLNQYRFTTRLSADGAQAVSARVRTGAGEVIEVVTLIALASATPAPSPASPDEADGGSVPVVLAVGLGLGLLALVVLVPPRVARARRARAPLQPPPTGVVVGGGLGGLAVADRPAPGPSALGGEQVEGPLAVGELLRAGRRRARDLWVTAGLAEPVRTELLTLAAERRVPVRHVTVGELAAEAVTDRAAGVLAHAAPLPVVPLGELLWRPHEVDHGSEPPPPTLMVVGGEGEGAWLGEIVLAAAGSGVAGLVLVRARRGRITAPATVAAGGAIERLPIALVAGLAVAAGALRAAGAVVVGIDPKGAPLDEVVRDLDESFAGRPVAVLLGGDGKLDRRTASRCEVLASPGGTSSLVPEQIAVVGGALARRLPPAAERAVSAAETAAGQP